MSTDIALDDRSRVAVITGASSGIGEATARASAADGYRVRCWRDGWTASHP